ncbi:ATP-binding protein [Patescibacteria group bacterium]|nr:ATP-binding protein [Patescibacteria group bacterium]
MIKRTLEYSILDQKNKFLVIAITGPRQSGKTTLAKKLFSKYKYYNLEDLNTKQVVKNDPVGFIEKLQGPVIIDEIQKIPDLLSQIQVQVDVSKLMGQFVITGSENLVLSAKISQSLAGRVANNILLPLSYRELTSAKGQIKDLDLQMLTGFYPRIYDTKMNYQDFYPEYINTYVEKDVRQLKNIGNLSSFERFLQLLAGRVGQILNLSSLANDVGVTHNTIEQWISTLEASYIAFRLQPFYSNLGKRVIKSPKIYFYDTGLLCYLLGINSPQEFRTHFAYGNIFENLVIVEVKKQILHNKLSNKIYFYRDSNQVEMDLVIDAGSSLRYCEIKSSRTFNKNYLKNFSHIKQPTQVPTTQHIIYQGELEQNIGEVKLLNFRHLDQLTKVV